MNIPKLSRQAITTRLRQMIEFIKNGILIWGWHTITFTGLLLAYLSYIFFNFVLSLKFWPVGIKEDLRVKLKKIFFRILTSSTKQERTINRVTLIELAIKNMLFKRSRAFITVGGMAIGIGAIVFLVSIGFGLQELVVSRVARLDELRQADVNPQPGSKEFISDKTISDFKKFSDVDQVLPMIAIVARVEFQNSVSDMPVYGVTSEFLKQSAVQPTFGKLFDSNEIASVAPAGIVAGISTTIDDSGNRTTDIDPRQELPIEFNVAENAWIKVRSGASKNSPILGYARRVTENQSGYKVWGEPYSGGEDFIKTLRQHVYAPWIKGDFELWENAPCEEIDPECRDGTYTPLRDIRGDRVIKEGYTSLSSVTITTTLEPEQTGDVLGLTTDETEPADSVLNEAEATETTAAVDSGITATDNLGWVEIASESALIETEKITKVALGSGAVKQAVVNSAMLKILGITDTEAVGKKFKTSFVVVGDLLSKPGEKLESIPEEYEIVGVIPDDKTAYFYVPFVDLRLLGINQYSQLKIVTKSPEGLQSARRQVETFGFITRSVADTVQQIDRLFGTARILLAILGFVALSIAALGMFNTLTVSLLERTREVGLMKAMGMRSNEVQELFLTESLVMGFFGGVVGIFLGVVGGELLSALLSGLAASKNLGYLDVSFLPTNFVIFVFLLSLLVGVFTGVYPARRATRISALDALRYE